MTNTPVELKALMSAISPEAIERFCREKALGATFEQCRTDAGHLTIKRNRLDPQSLSALWDMTADGSVRVIGRFMFSGSSPVLIYAVNMRGPITSRSSRKKQADFAAYRLKVAKADFAAAKLSGWETRSSRGLFFFYDEAGNFRMSLIESEEKKLFRRFTFFVEKDETGTKNRTFRYRMTNAQSVDKAASGQMEKWVDYRSLKAAFSVETLNKEFYDELSRWYFYALDKVRFPGGMGKTQEERNATGLIRLITRLIFVWFMKQKGLIREELFDQNEMEKHLWLTDSSKSTYYKAVLQNLFFTILNTEMGQRRDFDTNESATTEAGESHGVGCRCHNKFYIRDPKAFFKVMHDIPFLNGGLFAGLDANEDNKDGKEGEVLDDGTVTVTRDADLLEVPDSLFWEGTNGEKSFDLNTVTQDKKPRMVEVFGLITILKRYDFTVDESSKDDETVALDPELLGRVFENLLASYNPETSTSARKATGSFYTPREIVNYMVEESLVQHLKTKLQVEEEAAEHAFRRLVAGGEVDDGFFSPQRRKKTIDALKGCKILDPACGSGAFPMGILQAMLRALEALDPVGEDDSALYQRKLELIENCIYGVDIQPIAVQISKLRCFISLLADDKVDDKLPNRGIEPLPNLEMHFVAADSLVGVDSIGTSAKGTMSKGKKVAAASQRTFGDFDKNINRLKDELMKLRQKWLTVKGSNEKKALQRHFFDKQRQLADALAQNRWYGQQQTKALVSWDPFDQQTHSPFFDPEWMFGVRGGFDVVIGNPPYIKEYTTRAAFDSVRGSPYYMGKMDLWYMFACYGIDLSKPHVGLVAFIAPNNWLTSYGASLLRTKIISDARILELTDFNDYKIFGAGIQTMVMLFQHTGEPKEYSFRIRRLSGINADWDDVTALLASEATSKTEYMQSTLKRAEKLGHVLSFTHNTKQAVLNKIDAASTFRLCAREVANGIHHHHDKVNSERLQALGEGFKLGDGIFVLSNIEKESLKLSPSELALIKPVYTTSDMDRWGIKRQNREWVIYTDSTFRDKSLMNGLPALKRHLDRFADVITSDNKPYGLHRARDERFFIGEKVVVARKCIDPMFTYVDIDSYVSAAFYIIKTSRANLLYLAGLLNSRVILFWLTINGKRQGAHFQLDKEPLLALPLVLPDCACQNAIADVVKRLMVLSKLGKYGEVASMEASLDNLVYRLYGLTNDEIEVVEEVTASTRTPRGKEVADSSEMTQEEAEAAPTAELAASRPRGRRPKPDTGLDI